MTRSVAAEPRKAGTTNTDAEVSAAASSEVPPALDVVAGYAWRLIVLAIAAGLVALSVARLWLVVLPIVVALFLATVLVPIVAWLRRRGVPSLVATWVTMFGAILLVGGFSVALTAAALREIDGLNLNRARPVDVLFGELFRSSLSMGSLPVNSGRGHGALRHVGGIVSCQKRDFGVPVSQDSKPVPSANERRVCDRTGGSPASGQHGIHHAAQMFCGRARRVPINRPAACEPASGGREARSPQTGLPTFRAAPRGMPNAEPPNGRWRRGQWSRPARVFRPRSTHVWGDRRGGYQHT